MAIDPWMQTNLKSDLAQGHNVGDRDYGPDGYLYRWDGNSWTLEPAHMQPGGVSPSGGGGGTAPKFTFDWEKARTDALTQLTPYYEQKLKEAGGDIERAKRLIEEDYQRGLRISKEDLTTTNKQAEEDLTTQLKALGLETAEETRDLSGTLNARGVYTGEIQNGSSVAPVSGYAQTWHTGPLKERQDLRKLAIERAVSRQKEAAGLESSREEEKLGIARKRGIEEEDIQYPRTQRELEEEKRRRAYETVAPMKYEEEYAKYRAVNNLG